MPMTKTDSDPLTSGLNLDDPGSWVRAEDLTTLYPALWNNQHSIRWDLRNRKGTGLGRFVRIIGKRTIVHRDAAARWKLAQAQARDTRRA